MKIGVNLKIDVKKLIKERFFQGAKGTYADLTVFIDTENVSQYGDNGIISQSSSKEERDGGLQLPICGNAKVFYKAESDAPTQGNQQNTPQQQQQSPGPGPANYHNAQQQPAGQQAPPPGGFDDDIPF